MVLSSSRGHSRLVPLLCLLPFPPLSDLVRVLAILVPPQFVSRGMDSHGPCSCCHCGALFAASMDSHGPCDWLSLFLFAARALLCFCGSRRFTRVSGFHRVAEASRIAVKIVGLFPFVTIRLSDFFMRPMFHSHRHLVAVLALHSRLRSPRQIWCSVVEARASIAVS